MKGDHGMAQLGDVYIDVVYSEKPEGSVKSTDHPVESGEPLVDHIEQQPDTLNLTGVITGTDAPARLRKLEQYRKGGEVLTYTHRNGMNNVIIESFNRVHDNTVAGGFTFTMRLKQIRIALSSPITVMAVNTKAQAAPVANKGQQQPQQPGKMTPAQLAAANGNHVKGK